MLLLVIDPRLETRASTSELAGHQFDLTIATKHARQTTTDREFTMLAALDLDLDAY